MPMTKKRSFGIVVNEHAFRQLCKYCLLRMSFAECTTQLLAQAFSVSCAFYNISLFKPQIFTRYSCLLDIVV